MGVPRVMPRTIEIAGVAGVIEGAMVNVGNPHFVIFVESEDFSSHGMTLAGAGREDCGRSAVQVRDECGVCAGAVGGRDCVPHLRARMRADDVVGHGDVRGIAAAMALRGRRAS